jgi:outer membrane beta-barrel protein
MNRTAVCLCVGLAISAWAAVGHAKKGGAGGGGGKAAPAAETAAAEGDDKAAAADDKSAAPAAAAPADEPVGDDSADEKPAPGENEPEAKPAPLTTESWKDIVVVPRKAFLKGGRLELAPFTGTSINDNLIRHYAFGVDLNYFLTDVFSVGVEGQYFVKALTEREELIGLQYNRTTTLNRYLFAAALNFGYVPVYGKFAFLNKSIVHWEIYASAGIGWTRSEIIPRDPGNLSWTNDLLTPNAGLGSRFFLFDWLTVNFAVRDYFFADKFESLSRSRTDTIAFAKAHADSQFVQNVMFYAGVGMYLPTKFTYKSPR